MQLVVHTAEGIGQRGQSLSSGARLLGVEEQQNEVGPRRIPFNNLFEVIPALHIRGDGGVQHRGAVDHARSVDNHEVLYGYVRPYLQLQC